MCGIYLQTAWLLGVAVEGKGSRWVWRENKTGCELVIVEAGRWLCGDSFILSTFKLKKIFLN